MGSGKSTFEKEELDDYEDLTFFTRKEIIQCHKKFKKLAPSVVDENRNARLPMEIILNYPPLKHNPFGDRICMIFSSNKDGDCNFEDFLDMMSAFSDKAPISIKTEYAFRIFDFDGDDMLGTEDLEEVIRRLAGDERITRNQVLAMVKQLAEEVDLDDDGMLSYAEFEHAISKSEDFERSFTVKLH